MPSKHDSDGAAIARQDRTSQHPNEGGKASTRWHVDERSDSVVGAPLPRETVVTAQTGFLAVCDDDWCSWEGLFPTQALATDAVERHVQRAKRSDADEYHYGAQHPFVVEFVDDRTAQICPDQELNPLKPWFSHMDGQQVSRVATDRPSLEDVLFRGDLVDVHGPGLGKIARVNRTRALGVPAYSVIYVPPATEPTQDGTYPERSYKYLNNYVARDGGMQSVFRANDVVTFEGHADAQSGLDRWTTSR